MRAPPSSSAAIASVDRPSRPSRPSHPAHRALETRGWGRGRPSRKELVDSSVRVAVAPRSQSQLPAMTSPGHRAARARVNEGIAVAETIPPPESSPGSRSLVGRKIGRYIVDRLLGKGGMATVWRAVHEELGGEVAIKVLAPEAVRSEKELERFFQEAKVSAGLNHDHVVKVIDFAKDPSVGSYIVMELLNGRGLDRVLQAEGPLDEGRVVALALQITDALAAAHAHGIVHRDLKPANIFVTKTLGTEVVKVVDFGIAKLPSSRALALTRPGDVYGTPLYMSPEQWDNGPITEASDIYSLGVVLYEMLAGKPPHNGSALTQLVVSVALSDPYPLTMHRPTISPALDAVVQRCLRKRPADRFASMRELREALERSQGRLDITQTLPGSAGARESRASLPASGGAAPVRESRPSLPARDSRPALAPRGVMDSVPPSVTPSIPPAQLGLTRSIVLPLSPLPRRRTMFALAILLGIAAALIGIRVSSGQWPGVASLPFVAKAATAPAASPSSPANATVDAPPTAVANLSTSPPLGNEKTSESSAVPSARSAASAAGAKAPPVSSVKRARPAPTPAPARPREAARPKSVSSAAATGAPQEDDLLRKE